MRDQPVMSPTTRVRRSARGVRDGERAGGADDDPTEGDRSSGLSAYPY